MHYLVVQMMDWDNQVISMKCSASLIASFILAIMLIGCATPPPSSDKEATLEYHEINDPLEPTNRAVFEINRVLDEMFLQPVARAYRSVVPVWFRARISASLDNLRAPVVFFNELAQGEPKRAASTFVRFGLNSTFGLVGLNDFAKEIGFEKRDEDFGQTLATWRIDAGPYLMLPIFGPSNPRDAVGRIVDIVIDPFNMWTRNTNRETLAFARGGTEILDTRTSLLDFSDDLEKSSLDLYAAVRSLYRQRRLNDIHNGNIGDLSTIPGATNFPSWGNESTNEEISTKP